MAEYTYKDIIIDPEDPRLEGAIGKECYFSDYPKKLLNNAINNSPKYLSCLTNISKEGIFPFVSKNGSGWTLVIVKKEEPYSERAKKWIEENNLKVGDYVKVTRRAENHADGLDDYWYDLMRDSVGKILKVKEISNFIMLDNGINYPYFVLEKIEPPKPKYVPFENVTEFLNAYRSVANWLGNQDLYLLNHGIWLKAKYADDALFMVTEIWSYGVVFSCDMKTTEELEGKYLTINEVTTWKELFRDYCFIDGSPCGKEVKE